MLRQPSSNYRYDAVWLVTEVLVGLSTQLYPLLDLSIYILCDVPSFVTGIAQSV
jgi:hypothetical protein